MHKDLFINKYKKLNIFKNYKIFLNKMKELKLYKVEFDKNSAVKPKTYFSNCVFEGNN